MAISFWVRGEWTGSIQYNMLRLVVSNLYPRSRNILFPAGDFICVSEMDGHISHDQATSTEDKTAVAKAVTRDPEKQVLEHKNVDAALEFLNTEELGSMSEVDEKKLLHKIDWRIVPLMCTSWRRSTAQWVYWLLLMDMSRGLLQPSVPRQDSHQLCQCDGP